MSKSNDEIELALQSLEKGIDNLFQRVSRKKPHLDTDRAKKQVNRLLCHIRHLLTQLTGKRASLQALIEWFTTEWKSRLECYLGNPHCTHRILAHALQCLVRCQDGFVLLTSGECRHPVDIEEAKKTNFPSRLTTLQERADGYTKLYSGIAYSGFGWDEYANETVGIQARLVRTLRPFHKDPWGYLEGSTQLLEALLDRHENSVKSLKQSLHSIKSQMTTDITKRLAKPIIFSTQDKMEKLQVLVPARGTQKEQKLSVARLANNFQIHDQSVLPNEFQEIHSWNRALALNLAEAAPVTNGTSTVGQKRRRMAIQEDSDCSDAEQTNECKRQERRNDRTKAALGTGLEVRVETLKSVTETEESLRAIKQQMGINPNELEVALQDLEQESHSNRPEISVEEENVQRLTKVLQRAEQRQCVDRDDNEIWDARECLRQAYMELGNQLLWSSEPCRMLDRALASFEKAKGLVIQQQYVHRRLVMATNDQTNESKIISRNLQFLLAQATTNAGIVLVETAHSRENPTTNCKALAGAIRELESARDLLSQLRVEVLSDMSLFQAHSDPWISLKEFILETETLHVLVYQWLGIALLQTNQSDRAHSARKVLAEGWSFFQGFNVACLSRLLIPQLNLAVETINTTSVAAEMAQSKLEAKDYQSSQAFEEHCLLIVTGALTKQAEVLRSLEALYLSSEALTKSILANYYQDKNLSTSYDIEKIRDEILTWWNERKKQIKLSDKNTAGATTPSCRSMLSVKGRHKRQLRRISSHRSNAWAHLGTKGPMSDLVGDMEVCLVSSPCVNLVGRSLITEVKYKRPERFRKWGEEIVLSGSEQVGDASNVSALPLDKQNRVNDEHSQSLYRRLRRFPTTSPPMPLELKRVHEALNLRQDQVFQ